jgi:hypothetical protein
VACLVWAVLEEAVGSLHVQVSIEQRITYSVALGGWAELSHWLHRSVYSQCEVQWQYNDHTQPIVY